jgi:hypothetical protein
MPYARYICAFSRSVADAGGRTFVVYPDLQIVCAMFDCVTAGSTAPGVHEESGRGPDRAWHEVGADPVTFPGSCTWSSPAERA